MMHVSQAEFPANAISGVRRLLVPIDGSAASLAALSFAAELAQRNKGKVYAIYIIEVTRSLPLDAALPAEVEHCETIFTAAKSTIKGLASSIEFELLQARNAGATIVDEAVNIEAQAIVMGLGDKRRRGEFVIGQTTDFVLRHAPCQVWLFRAPLAEAR